MELFIKAIFWLFLIETFVKAFNLLAGAYPYKKEHTMAEGFMDFIYFGGFGIWAAYLLWIK